MYTIRIQYCVGDFRNMSFREISEKDYRRFVSAVENLQKINQETFWCSTYVDPRPIRAECQRQHKLLDPKYEQAVKRLNEIKIQYRKVLERTEELEDHDFSYPLSWIILGIERQEALHKHKQKYAYVYDEIKRLNDEITKLAPYSKARIQDTIKYAIEREESKKKSDATNKRYQWEQNQIKKRREQQDVLKELKGGDCLVEGFTATTNGNACAITGTKILISSGLREWFNQTLINKTVQIIR